MKKNCVQISDKRYQELLAAEQKAKKLQEQKAHWKAVDFATNYGMGHARTMSYFDEYLKMCRHHIEPIKTTAADWAESEKSMVKNLATTMNEWLAKSIAANIDKDACILDSATELNKKDDGSKWEFSTKPAIDPDKIMRESSMKDFLRKAGWNSNVLSNTWFHEKTVKEGNDPAENTMSVEQAYGWEKCWQFFEANEIKLDEDVAKLFYELAEKLPKVYPTVQEQVDIMGEILDGYRLSDKNTATDNFNFGGSFNFKDEFVAKGTQTGRFDSKGPNESNTPQSVPNPAEPINIETQILSGSEPVRRWVGPPSDLQNMPKEKVTGKQLHTVFMHRSDRCVELEAHEVTELNSILSAKHGSMEEADKAVYKFLKSLPVKGCKEFTISPTSSFSPRYLSVYQATLNNYVAKLIMYVTGAASTYFEGSDEDL